MRNINLRYVNETYNELNQLETFDVNCPDDFNFGYDVVDDIAENDPNRMAMVWCNPEGEEHLFTFADMKYWSDKTANFLAENGIGAGDMVMVILRRHYQFWFVATALHKLGAVMIPATFMLKEHDLEYRLNGAGVKSLIVTDAGDIAEVCDRAEELCPTLETKILVNAASALEHRQQDGSFDFAAAKKPCGAELSGPEGLCAAPVSRAGWLDFNTSVRAASEIFEKRTTASAEPMLAYFSSGTSGNPKLVLHDSAYALAHLMTAKHWHNVEPDGVHFTIADTGWGKAVWGKFYGQWLMEACVLTYDFDRFVADEILALVSKYRLTSFCCPPTMYRLMMQSDITRFDLTSLVHLSTAGEALNPDIFDFWLSACGLTIYEGFGQTETVVSIGNLTNSTPRSGSMGKPVPLYQVEIKRADGSRCDTGETGEICISVEPSKPAGIMMGYYRDEEKTAEAIYDGWYHTGDTAWCDEDGYLWYVGRNDDVIKSSGYRIGPFEIESVLLEHDAVSECAVTGVPDPLRTTAVKATIVLAPGFSGSDELTNELQTWVKEQTAPYKFPRIIDYVSELPKTVNGKIRRSVIREKDYRSS
ncbi:MAG: AMP-binding protein [Eggerthellaceae bacterium]|nr:AMP-binding protein [Eggerthellaceae bacterium]MDR2721705.1 AMP-binding protein [Coriobacteriaceae bacterium]